jgi:hypothetical protein
MDMTASIAPNSDQLDAEDLLSGPRDVTIVEVRQGPSGEQPVNIFLEEFDRPWRPAKTVRRILVAAWGPDAAAYVGHRLRIYRDPEVRFGGMAVGGIRVSHLSHIEKRMQLALTSTRGKRGMHVIEPLTKAAPQPLPRGGEPTAEQVAACTDVDTLKGMWRASGPERREQITARVAELKAAPAEDDGDPTFPGGDAA